MPVFGPPADGGRHVRRHQVQRPVLNRVAAGTPRLQRRLHRAQSGEPEDGPIAGPEGVRGNRRTVVGVQRDGLATPVHRPGKQLWSGRRQVDRTLGRDAGGIPDANPHAAADAEGQLRVDLSGDTRNNGARMTPPEAGITSTWTPPICLRTGTWSFTKTSDENEAPQRDTMAPGAISAV